MNKKSKKTLKNAFNIPEPERKEEFLNSLPTRQKKSFSFNVPLYISTAVTAVVIIGIWGGIKNLPYFDQPESIDTPVYSESTSLTNHTEKSSVKTTTVSSTEKNTENTTVTSAVSTVRTSGKGTVSGTEKSETKVSVQTTIKSETVRTETITSTTITKESNNISHKPTTEIHTDEITTAPETEFPETTTKTSAVTTALRTTTKTTVKSTTTATTSRTTSKTTVKPTTTATTLRTTSETDPPVVTTTSHTTTTTNKTILFPMTTTTAESEVNYVTTTTFMNGGSPGSAVNVTTQTNVASVDIPPQIATTTKEDNGMCSDPPRDFTVVPTVQYYPDGEIYFIDSESNDTMPPTASDPVEMFRKMAEDSDLIVIVTVDEIIYTGFDGKPYTQENAIVNDVIYGDIPVNSRISIYCTGGYIPANEYYNNIIEDNVTILDYAGNRDFSQVGDSYICFLKKSDGTFPDGSYYLTGFNDISKFAPYGDNYVNLNNNNSLALSQIQSFLNQ